MATQPLPSWGPRNGEETTSLYNRWLLGVPTMGESQYGDTAPALLGSQPWEGVQMATQPLPSSDPRNGEVSIWLHNPCLLGNPTMGRSQ